MLTPTDTQYVAGLLTLCSSPEGVEVEVGTMIADQGSEIERDVDITMQARDRNGRTVILMGREVKAHRRPLDSTHVEQLACKLNDMPDLGGRGIVSASGYTSPALKKAAKHGIVLYELVELRETDQAFEHFLSRKVPFVRQGLQWQTVDHVHVNPRTAATQAQMDACRENAPVLVEGKTDPASSDLQSYLGLIRKRMLNDLMEKWPETDRVPGFIRPVRLTMLITPPRAEVAIAGGNFPIEEVVVSGSVRWHQETNNCPMMVLRQLGKEKPDAGCCVFEWEGLGLCGLIVSNSNRDIRLMHIPVSDRNKKKIYRQTLRHVVKADAPIEDSGRPSRAKSPRDSRTRRTATSPRTNETNTSCLNAASRHPRNPFS